MQTSAQDRPFRSALIWGLCLWAVFAAVSVLSRPLFPVDETRYLTVAWEMHVNDDYILPTLNFEPYHHKPPLMFWSINLMWALFGISRFAASLVPVLFAFGALTASALLAKTLWPERRRSIAPLTILLGAGSLPFLVYGTLFLFDYMLALCVALAMAGVWRFSRHGKFSDILLFGAAVGLGVLAKGPVILLHVIFPVLLAPLWANTWRTQGRGWARWYLSFAGGIAIGAAIALCWAIPAALRGGPEYREMIFWGQSAGRMVQSFDHKRPFWYYLPFLPLFFAPWIFWPRLWRKALALRSMAWSAQGKFLALWTIPVFVAFSLISGKQVHYLVPLTPALWAGLAFLLSNGPQETEDTTPHYLLSSIRKTALVLASVLALGQIVAGMTTFRLYNLDPLAEAIQPWLGRPIAFVQNWHGELGFLARMTGPVTSLSEEGQLAGWFEDHPDGVAIVRHRKPVDATKYDILFEMPFKGRRLYSIIALKSAGLGENPVPEEYP